VDARARTRTRMCVRELIKCHPLLHIDVNNKYLNEKYNINIFTL